MSDYKPPVPVRRSAKADREAAIRNAVQASLTDRYTPKPTEPREPIPDNRPPKPAAPQAEIPAGLTERFPTRHIPKTEQEEELLADIEARRPSRGDLEASLHRRLYPSIPDHQ